MRCITLLTFKMRMVKNVLSHTFHSLLCWHRPIFPGRFQPSIFGTGELNFCVRNGNRWTLTAIGTNFTATAFRRRYIKQVSLIYSNIFIFQLIGDPYEIRTRVAGVRGRSLRPLDQRATFTPFGAYLRC